ncbi:MULTISPECIES: hypothetical protein [unclassified Yoonia]|uniref:hypothetical protein n=1 Tax=unclassified Yoonia TaxID=2629118 RepID=UPI002AFF6C04|nr:MULTISPECIES: hypothetical protein [unclassified Yoonia]
MESDVIIVAGMVAVIIGIAALVSAFTDRRWPWVALALFIIGGGAITYAVRENPGLYAIDRLDQPVFNVIARIIN